MIISEIDEDDQCVRMFTVAEEVISSLSSVKHNRKVQYEKYRLQFINLHRIPSNYYSKNRICKIVRLLDRSVCSHTQIM